jgi:hypothetical protein
MNGLLSKQVGAAARSAWVTLVVMWVLMMLSWGGWLLLLHARPEWYLSMIGDGTVTWEQLQHVVIWFYGAFKVGLAILLAAAIWLSLWAGHLRKID